MANRFFSPLIVQFWKDEEIYSILDQGGFEPDIETMGKILSFAKAYIKKNTDDSISMRNIALFQETEKRARNRPKPQKVDSEYFLYIIHDYARGFYKVGRCVNVSNRFKQLRTANPNIELVSYYDAKNEDEFQVHELLKSMGKHVDGEWFSINADDIKLIEEHLKTRHLTC